MVQKVFEIYGIEIEDLLLDTEDSGKDKPALLKSNTGILAGVYFGPAVLKLNIVELNLYKAIKMFCSIFSLRR